MERETFAIVLSGPSGAGKSSLLQQTIKEMDDIKYSVSATTRPPRADEVDGVNYFFLSSAEFGRAIFWSGPKYTVTSTVPLVITSSRVCERARM